MVSWVTTKILGWAIAGMGGVILLLSLALWVQDGRLDRCRADKARIQGTYDSFVAETKRQGEEATKKAKQQAAQDKANKEKSDADTNKTLAALRADNKRLRDERRTRGSYVPPAAPGARDPDTACFDRPLLERAIRQFDEAVAGLIGEGDEARAGLDGVRKWSQQP